MIIRRIVSILSFLFVLSTAQARRSSGCSICATTGNCVAAFKGGPGQFCGYFHEYAFETKPCCCPNNAYCNMSPFECLCHVPDTPYYNYSLRDDSIGGFIFLMILICICCTCCNACASGGSSASSYEERNTFIPVAVPAEGNPPPTAPGAY